LYHPADDIASDGSILDIEIFGFPRKTACDTGKDDMNPNTPTGQDSEALHSDTGSIDFMTNQPTDRYSDIAHPNDQQEGSVEGQALDLNDRLPRLKRSISSFANQNFKIGNVNVNGKTALYAASALIGLLAARKIRNSEFSRGLGDQARGRMLVAKGEALIERGQMRSRLPRWSFLQRDSD
jgi:hypothetical protein